MIGGIDLGGTKIEARVFDPSFNEHARHRIATPTKSYESLLSGIMAQISWLRSQANMDAIGLGTPGLIHPKLGTMLTANLPATGQSLVKDLSSLAGQDIAVINDCRAFTLSEASLGAGRDFDNVIGLVIGTGVAGGHAFQKQIMPDQNGQHGEYGHLPLPAETVAKYGLPLVRCGCGLTGCFETLVAGPGLVRLAKHVTGRTESTQVILSSPDFSEARNIWVELCTCIVAMIARTNDPDVIVLGGGLGMVDGLPGMIRDAIPPMLLRGTDLPNIVQAIHGDASGALGAALFASGTISDQVT